MTFSSRLIPGVILFAALGPMASASSLPVTISAATHVSTGTVAAYRASIGTTRVTARRTRNTRLVPSRLARTRARARRVFWNPLLRGSHESQLRQNEEIDQLGLPRIEDESQLQELVERQELGPL